MSEFLSEKKWIAVDTETTGLNPWKHELIEIGAVRFGMPGIEDRFEVLIRPSKKQDPRAREVHNISNEELEEKGVSIEEGVRLFLDFLGDEALVFHNAPFDISFLTMAMKKAEAELPQNLYYDNLWLSRKYFPKRSSHSLHNLKKELNIETGAMHRALADAEATAHVFLHTLKENATKLSSPKKYNSFMRFHRRFHDFKIVLPRNLEKIQKYFDKPIKSGSLLKMAYTDREGKRFNQLLTPREVMIFNQRVYLKVHVHPTKEEKLVPLKNAVVFDPEMGTLKF